MSSADGYDTILVDIDERGVALVTVNRPDVRNAFNALVIQELTTAAQRLAADDGVRVVVLTGAGTVFSAGGDLNWMGSMREFTLAENAADSVRMNALFRTLWDLPKPLIGRINGHAIAGGTGLAAVCDIVISVRAALFGLTEVVLGLAPAVISPYVIRKIGFSHARALFVTGELFDAVRGHHIGLVHELVDDVEALDDAVSKAVTRCLKAGPMAVGVAKTVPEIASLPLDEATSLTPPLIARLRVSDEGQEGIAAFFEKRPASWVPASPDSEG